MMKIIDLLDYTKKLFQNEILLALSFVGTLLYRFFFPEQQYLLGAAAVFAIMALDLLTKLIALSRRSGGFFKAIKTHKITSAAFAKGTIDKLIIFAVMLIICGCAYRLVVIADIAVWFTQIVFTLMFLRDLLSIIENLSDAGVGGLGPFRKVVKKKMSEFVDPDDTENIGGNSDEQ